jgi:hypothetical protein
MINPDLSACDNISRGFKGKSVQNSNMDNRKIE